MVSASSFGEKAITETDGELSICDLLQKYPLSFLPDLGLNCWQSK